MNKKILSLKELNNNTKRQEESIVSDSYYFKDIYIKEKENSVNLKIPISKMDNEQYKILKCKDLKRPNSLAYFSVKKIFTEDNEEDYTKYKEFSSLKKKKLFTLLKKSIHHFINYLMMKIKKYEYRIYNISILIN